MSQQCWQSVGLAPQNGLEVDLWGVSLTDGQGRRFANAVWMGGKHGFWHVRDYVDPASGRRGHIEAHYAVTHFYWPPLPPQFDAASDAQLVIRYASA